MKIKILKECSGSQNGISVETFVEGQEVDIVDKLAQVFISQKWAVPAGATMIRRSIPPSTLIEEKALTGAPENKAMIPAEENKQPPGNDIAPVTEGLKAALRKGLKKK